MKMSLISHFPSEEWLLHFPGTLCLWGKPHSLLTFPRHSCGADTSEIIWNASATDPDSPLETSVLLQPKLDKQQLEKKTFFGSLGALVVMQNKNKRGSMTISI